MHNAHRTEDMLPPRIHHAMLVVGCLMIPILLGAQVLEPSFQLVSIRRAQPAPCPPQVLCIGAVGPSTAPSTMQFLPGGRLEVRNATLESLVRVAFGLEQFDPRAGMVDTSRLPSARVTRFDITAIGDREWTAVSPGQVPPELRVMLRQLLETRFKLKTRSETKKVDVGAARLVANQPGPGLVRASGDCLGPFTSPPLSGAAAPLCPFRRDLQRIEAGSITMSEVMSLLSRLPGMSTRVLVDDTGLPGRWDVHFDLADVYPRTYVGGSPEMAEKKTRDALSKQLGIRIVKASIPMATVKIEHAENPQED
jgi:uncharacterized protein (TIGR03435 family)